MEYLGMVFALVVSAVGMMKVMARAGEPSWAAFVPLYNFVILLKIANRPSWWVVLMLIPVVNLVTMFLMWRDLSARFGRGPGFAIGLLLMPPLFLLVLGFSESPAPTTLSHV